MDPIEKKSFFQISLRRTIPFVFGSMFFFFVFESAAQDPKERLRLAEELERGGQGEAALNVYEQLYNQNPEDVVVFNLLRDSLIRMQRYQRALDIIERRQQKYPDDPTLWVSRGQVLHKMGRQDEALKVWYAVLNRHSQNSSVYVTVANAMILERLFDEAADVYLLGRKKIGNKDIFVFHLANLYGARMDYEKAADELVGYLDRHPEQASIIQNQLAAYPQTDRVIRIIEKKLKNVMASRPEDPRLRQVLADVYLRAGRYHEGLQLTLEIERLTEKKKQGEALFSFGQAAFRSGAPQEAEKAFMEILTSYNHVTFKDGVLFALAQCYEVQEKFREAVDVYRKIFEEYGEGDLAARSLYRKGLLQKNKLFDLSGAEETFQNVIQKFPASREAEEGQLELGDCYLNQGALDRAETVFRQAVESSQKKRDPVRIKAVVRLAEATYMQGRFDEALSLLDGLASENLEPFEMQDPELNDGLNLRLFIKEYSGRAPEPLRFFARSALLERQRKYQEAVVVLDSLITKWPQGLVTAEGLFKRGEIEIQMGLLDKSLANFDTLLTRFPSSLLADRSLERKGWVYETMGKKDRALKSYETLLVLYPQSFLVDEVRQRIRTMEKEAP